MSEHWNPMKKEIKEWLDERIHEFATQENRNAWISEEQWLECYLYTEIQEIFFFSFPFELYEWIAKLAESQGRCKLDKLIVWTPELMRRLEASEDRIVRTVGHWLDRTIGNFITEFAVDTTVSYNEA